MSCCTYTEASADNLGFILLESATIANRESSSRHNHGEVCGKPSLLAEHACCTDDIVVISSHGANASQLDVLLVDQMNLTHSTSIDAKGEITCIGLFKASAQTYIIAGSVTEGLPLLTIYSLAGLEISSNVTQPDLGKSDVRY